MKSLVLDLVEVCSMSAILTKSISNFGRWAQNKAVNLEKFLRLYKDVFAKGKVKFRILAEVSLMPCGFTCF